MDLLKQLITGSDNETYAIGRVLGMIEFGVFLVVVPLAVLFTLAKGWVSSDSWRTILEALAFYVPAVAVSIAGLIGLTAFSEPKPKGDGNAGSSSDQG